MLRRQAILAVSALAALAALPVQAQSKAPRVDVVKIMSLTCPVCRSAEAQDKAIAQVVRDGGGQFVWAPLPTEEEALLGARERVYYAGRTMDPAFGEYLKDALYRGAQDMGIPLNDYLQVYTWLMQDDPSKEGKFHEVIQKAQEPDARGALARAARLAQQAGVSSLPGYIVLVDGRIAALMDPDSVQGNSLIRLRDDVIKAVRTLGKQINTTP